MAIECCEVALDRSSASLGVVTGAAKSGAPSSQTEPKAKAQAARWREMPRRKPETLVKEGVHSPEETMPTTTFAGAIRYLARFISATAVGVLVASAPAAAQTLAESRAAAGRVWYDRYCTQCHGPGGAPGKAVFAGTEDPVDLRNYVARHGGKFPGGQWIAVVEQTDATAPHADVWQEILKDQPQTLSQRPVARGIVVLIADYVKSVQTK